LGDALGDATGDALGYLCGAHSLFDRLAACSSTALRLACMFYCF
jgi:hypothetical protein